MCDNMPMHATVNETGASTLVVDDTFVAIPAPSSRLDGAFSAVEWCYIRTGWAPLLAALRKLDARMPPL